MERPRRRGIGKTLPVGWMYMKPPDPNLKGWLREHIKSRREKEEQGLEQINARRKELDDMRDNLYAQLKEILMKNDGSKALQDELLKELMKKHNIFPKAGILQERQGGTDSSVMHSAAVLSSNTR
ncbi:unnamed protein product [Enterobius vermicularis]|uniref:Protein DYAD-like n=1 Tax=Enterobius vermicularis TaxID=51028 RepID=A0A0N4V372_ENTVE|nr:unnamed protein product [Enterobius vermicularis]